MLTEGGAGRLELARAKTERRRCAGRSARVSEPAPRLMGSLSKQDRERALQAFVVWCLPQLQGVELNDGTLEKLGFGSVDAMRTQLKNWGAPDWIAQEEQEDDTRQARGGEGATQELPAVSRAAQEDFREVIGELSSAVNGLPYVTQWLKDGRFTSLIHYTKESGMAHDVYIRGQFRDPGGEVGLRWKRVCEEHGQDPAVEEFKVPVDRPQYGGADWYPHDVLTELIAAYALSGRSVEHLLEELHPYAEISDRDAAEQKRDELLHKARQLAALVRGNRSAVKRGRKAESVTPEEQIFALWDTTSLEHIGMDQEEIERLTGLRLPHRKLKP
jgi:hypothetical protein